MTLSLAAWGGDKTPTVPTLDTTPSASSTDAAHWPYKDVTPEQELNTIYAFIEAGNYGVAKDMATVVEQYQVLLGAMPDLIAKVNEPYQKNRR